MKNRVLLLGRSAALSLCPPKPSLCNNFCTLLPPWVTLHANSEQVQPIYFGMSPRELTNQKVPEPAVITIPQALKELGECQLVQVLKRFSVTADTLLEAWPVYDQDTGQHTWAFVRQFLHGNASDFRYLYVYPDTDIPAGNCEIAPKIPILYRPWIEDEYNIIYTGDPNDLYSKPVYGDCLWTGKLANSPFYKSWCWLDSASFKASDDGVVCRAIPQPPRMDGYAFTVLINAIKVGVQWQISWPSNINWTSACNSVLPPEIHPPLTPSIQWPSDFAERYREDIFILSGEWPAVFPESRRVANFTRKNSGDPGNQLDLMTDYFIERYGNQVDNIYKTIFKWGDINQTNLIGIIKGKNSDLPPVLLADHFDTAFCEDIFDQTGKKVSAPGADDNVSATSALLRAAGILSQLKESLARDIWLVHLTGEEFPGDDLGIRYLVKKWLAENTKIKGVVLLDMIGWRSSSKDPIFQVNAGDSEESLMMARYAMDVAKYITKGQNITASFRSRFDKYSYLYNTDGVILSQNGFPVILINEHINHYENLDRPYYHQCTDKPYTLDWDYTTTVAKVAIETVLKLAME